MSIVMMLVVMLLSGGVATAQTSPTEPTALTLQHRLVNELATRGIDVTRRHLDLLTEHLSKQWVISLVDLTTGRVAASTKLDRLPAAPRASAAVIACVADDLASQLGHRSKAPRPTSVDEQAPGVLGELSVLCGSLSSGTPAFKDSSCIVRHRRWLTFRGIFYSLGPPPIYHACGAHTSSAPQQPPTEYRTLATDVDKELRKEGIVLARHNLELQLEPLPDRWLVSLVDLTTDKTATSTQILHLPPDRDAAAAVITQVVAGLESQVEDESVSPELPTASNTQLPSVPSVASAREETSSSWIAPRAVDHAQRDIAEREFRRMALRLRPSADTAAPQSISREDLRWRAIRGESNSEISASDFYGILGREDLAKAYERRHALMEGSFIVGGATIAAVSMLIVAAIEPQVFCDTPLAHSTATALIPGNCIASWRPSTNMLMMGLSIGLVAISIGDYFYLHPHPIDQMDARTLATAYNERLRKHLGLPTVTRRSILRELRLTPYINEHNAGLWLSAPL